MMVVEKQRHPSPLIDNSLKARRPLVRGRCPEFGIFVRGEPVEASKNKVIGGGIVLPRPSLPIATVPVVAPWVVSVATVTTVVIRAPPAAAIGATNPTDLLDFRRRIRRDRRDRHRRSCGHRNTATNCSSRKQERYFSHGIPPYTRFNVR
jgi:hypothetical protein